eukprot:CAMPEP_0185764012 /NCGR_PEP_ID=MMETSP1174-20130828/22912_1 /TAXON_ID=35687 /ORGANISM="Dictyocha speculum, Strain CCMP1381" /LENGTH=82 /DNA_ID=CAMNT_0028446357 /DNA_START=47 /DNA_END=295 /DNA_ORIENTATION=-
MHGSMGLVRVPAPTRMVEKHSRSSTDAKGLQDWLHHARGIECPVKCLDGELLVRISAHVYNEMEDYEKLSDAVQEFNWSNLN